MWVGEMSGVGGSNSEKQKKRGGGKGCETRSQGMRAQHSTQCTQALFCARWQTCCDATRMKINTPDKKIQQSIMAQLYKSTVGGLGTGVRAVQNRPLSSIRASFLFNAPLQTEFPLGA